MKFIQVAREGRFNILTGLEESEEARPGAGVFQKVGTPKGKGPVWLFQEQYGWCTGGGNEEDRMNRS